MGEQEDRDTGTGKEWEKEETDLLSEGCFKNQILFSMSC
jgi:hypothetical protein